MSAIKSSDKLEINPLKNCLRRKNNTALPELKESNKKVKKDNNNEEVKKNELEEPKKEEPEKFEPFNIFFLNIY